MRLKKIYWSMVDLQCYVNLFYTARWLSRDTYIYTYTYIYICIHTHVCLCVCTQSLSCIWLFASPWTVACQAPLSMEFSRKEYWSGLPFPPPGDLPDLGIEPSSPALAGRFFTTEPPGKLFICTHTQSYTYVLFMFFSIMVCHRMLNIVPLCYK